VGASADEVINYFAGNAAEDARSVKEVLNQAFNKSLAELGKDLDASQELEKRGVVGLRVSHNLEAAVQAAFPGWPEDTTAANRFASNVFVSGGKLSILEDAKSDAMAAIKRFAAVLWPGKELPESKHFVVSRWLAKGVKYCSASKIGKYRIELGPSIRRGSPTAEIFDSQALYKRKIGSGRSLPGSMTASRDWTQCRSIWVMTWTDSLPTFYSHIGKFGRFHHSSFKAGGAVMAAGEWVVAEGKLKMINACSGHYKPEAWRFAFAAGYLKDAGIIQEDTQIEVWIDGKRTLAPCLEFQKNMSAKFAQGYSLFPA
jgi:hypothetical protein